MHFYINRSFHRITLLIALANSRCDNFFTSLFFDYFKLFFISYVCYLVNELASKKKVPYKIRSSSSTRVEFYMNKTCFL